MLVLYYLNICLKQLYGFVINIYEMEPPRVLDKIPKWHASSAQAPQDQFTNGTYIRWLLRSRCARIEKSLVLSIQGISLDREQAQIWKLLSGKTFFLHAYTTCSELQYNITSNYRGLTWIVDSHEPMTCRPVRSQSIPSSWIKSSFINSII